MNNLLKYSLSLFLTLQLINIGVMGSTVLHEGVPSLHLVASTTPQYFSFPITRSDKPLLFIVTHYGNSRISIYGSDTDTTPGGEAPWTTTTDQLKIEAASLVGKDNFYIGVHGNDPHTFTIVAVYEDSSINLLDGRPQRKSQNAEQISHFKLVLEGDMPDVVTISALPLEGRIEMWIGDTASGYPSTPITDYTELIPMPYSGEPIRIHKNRIPVDQTFLISIKSETNAHYSIVGSTNNTILLDGISQRSVAAKDESQFYQLTVSRPNCKLFVVITSLSGDPDLYAQKGVQHPTIHSPNAKKSLMRGSDQVEFESTEVAEYYITVAAFTNSTYNILAYTECQNQIHAISLINGVPQAGGEKEQGEFRYYRIHTGSTQVPRLSVSITHHWGKRPLMFLKMDDGSFTCCTGWTRSHGRAIVQMESVQGDYILAVKAKHDSSFFTVTASWYSDQLKTLTQGVPFTHYLQRGQQEYFQIAVLKPLSTLNITVTPLGEGDPDVFISNEVTHPSFRNNTWSSLKSGQDTVSIPDTCYCIYYIAVRAFTNCTFQITATFEDEITLREGQPQNGYVARGAWRYYDLVVPDDDESLVLALTSRTGYAIAYMVSGTEVPGSLIDWSWHTSPWVSASSKVISRGDPRACSQKNARGFCVYRIGVEGMTLGSSYTLTASAAYTITDLSNAQPQTAHIGTGGWSYFHTRVESSGKDLSIIVTPISGDPDIYVSRSAHRPNETEGSGYDKKATMYGADEVFYPNAEIGDYWIGVKAFENSTFTILSLLRSNAGQSTTTTPLRPGVPQAGTLEKNQFRYYEFNLGQQSDLTISISRIYGDPDLVMTMKNDNLPNHGLPNATYYTWISDLFGNDQIFVPDAQAGVYYIGVSAFSSCQYNIVARTSENTVTLANGVAVSSVVAESTYNYYVVTLSERVPLRISLTVMAGSHGDQGDADLFVSRSVERPTSSTPVDQRWSGERLGSDSITISPDDNNYCVNCNYYIGVYGFVNSSYSILASFNRDINLEDGVSLHGEVHVGEWLMYRLNVATASDVSIDLNVASGSTDLYLSRVPINTANPMGLKRTSITSHGFIIDRNPCTDCTYYIGIRNAGDQGADYVLRGSLGTVDQSIGLRNNHPVHSWVDKHEYKYFHFRVYSRNVEVTFILTSITGDADLFVSDRSYPRITKNDRSSYNWTSSSVEGDIVDIDPSPQRPRNFNLAVYGFANSTFTLTARIRYNFNTTVRLGLGVPFSDIIHRAHFRYYSFFVDETNEKLVISLTPIAGDPDLYVKHDSLPTLADNDYNSTHWGADSITINSPKTGVLYIGVFAWSSCYYSLIVERNDTISELQEGIPVRKTLARHGVTYFKFLVVTNVKALTLQVTPFNGDPDIFASFEHQRPSSTTDNTYARRSRGLDTLTIPKDDLKLGKYLYIAVSAFTNTSFTVVMSYDQSVALTDGVQQSGTVESSQIRYYTFTHPEDTKEVFVNVSPKDGRVALYINYNSTQPNEKHHDESSRNPFGSQYLSLGACTNPVQQGLCFYTFGVMGVTHSNYSILVSSGRQAMPLRDGYPQIVRVVSQDYVYFTFVAEEHTESVMFSITPFYGKPVLYVGDRVLPDGNDETTYDQKTDAFGNIVIQVTKPKGQSKKYYLAVFGSSSGPTRFSIIAVSGKKTTVLLDGEPQLGTVGYLRNRLYKYEMDRSYAEVQNATISLTNYNGDADLCVSNEKIPQYRSDCKYLGTNYGTDIIRIPRACTPVSQSCTYFIIVMGTRSTTRYTITAASDSISTYLQFGIPVTKQIYSGEYQYYKITHEKLEQDLQVQLTTGSAGSAPPFIYMDTTNVHPDQNSQWKSTDGSNSLIVESTTSKTYYVAVKGNADSVYTITAFVEEIQLMPGRPQISSLRKGESKYYSFTDYYNSSSGVNSLKFMVSTTNSGKVSIYLRKGTKPTAQKSDIDGSVYNTTYVKERNTITIPASSSLSCKEDSCTYFVLVVAKTQTSFSILATDGNERILLDGVPNLEEITDTSKDVYEFYAAAESEEVGFSITMLEGSVNLVVKNSSGGVVHNEQDISIGSVSTYSNVIAEDSFYEVSLESPEKHSTYLLTGYTKNTKQLLDGKPAYSSPQDKNIFTFQLGQRSDIFINVVPVGVDVDQDIIVAVTPNSTYTTDNALIIHSRTINTMQFAKDRSDYCIDCVYAFEVISVGGNKFPYLFFVSTDGSHTQLVDSVAFGGHVLSGDYRYFDIKIHEASQLEIELDNCRGESSIFVSSNQFQPTSEEYEWFAEGAGVNTVSVKNKLLKSRTFIIAVKGKADTSTFQIQVFSKSSERAKPVTGNQGKITLDVIDSETTTLSFKAVELKEGQKEDKYTYTVYYEESKTAGFVESVCGLSKYGTFAKKIVIGKDGVEREDGMINIPIKLEPSKTGYRQFNVIVEDMDNHRKAAYRSVLQSNGTGGNLGTLLAIFIPTLTILILVVVYCIWKNRKLTKELDVEMSDHPKAVGVNKYGKLLQEDDDDDGNVGYNPPML